MRTALDLRLEPATSSSRSSRPLDDLTRSCAGSSRLTAVLTGSSLAPGPFAGKTWLEFSAPNMSKTQYLPFNEDDRTVDQ
jgi:hypothetical protein